MPVIWLRLWYLASAYNLRRIEAAQRMELGLFLLVVAALVVVTVGRWGANPKARS
jgi:hypothetical protein